MPSRPFSVPNIRLVMNYESKATVFELGGGFETGNGHCKQ